MNSGTTSSLSAGDILSPDVICFMNPLSPSPCRDTDGSSGTLPSVYRGDNEDGKSPGDVLDTLEGLTQGTELSPTRLKGPAMDWEGKRPWDAFETLGTELRFTRSMDSVKLLSFSVTGGDADVLVTG